MLPREIPAPVAAPVFRESVTDEPPRTGKGMSDELERAELLVREAWEKPNGRARVALARKAIAICSDTPDAWVLLGYFGEGNWYKKRSSFERAVEVATKSLGGKQLMKRFKGRFWVEVETRPYMRAREGLGYSYWKTGDREKAINEYKDLLELNPPDDQGVRYRLASWYLRQARHKDLTALLQRFANDPSATWPWTHALLAFVTEGNTPNSRLQLRAARYANRSVADHLLGRKLIPPQPPEVIGMGDEREALAYALENLECWNMMPGAVAWLAANEAD